MGCRTGCLVFGIGFERREVVGGRCLEFSRKKMRRRRIIYILIDNRRGIE